MVLSPQLRALVAIGLVLTLLGVFVLGEPANLWARLLGGILVLVAIGVGFAQQRRGR